MAKSLEGYNPITRYEAVAELAKVRKYKKIIDCSCGDGREGYLIIGKYRPRKYIGIDIDKEAIKKARRSALPNCYYFYGDIRNPLSEQFDYYFCVETLEHLAKGDNKIVASSIAKMLKPSGKLLISVPGNPKIAMEDKRHLQIVTKDKLVGMFKNFVLEAEAKYVKYLLRPEAYSSLYVFKKGV
jgi:SAM-dependent methyltransferase